MPPRNRVRVVVPVSVCCAAVLLTVPLAATAHEPAPVAFSVRSVADGNWSDAKTWTPPRVPRDGERVLVSRGTRVVYDVESAAKLRLVQIVGTLTFARDRNTLLNVGVLKVQDSTECSEAGFACDLHGVNEAGEPLAAPGGIRPALEVGTPDAPIPAKFTARIRLHHFPGMDTKDAPALVCCAARMEFHGVPMSRTWVELGDDAEPGHAVVTLAEDVTGWRAGDEVIVTGTHRRIREHGVPRDAPDAVATEQRRIVQIDGRQITLDRPLEHGHRGTGQFRGEVANLSRNVVVESADPDGVRGHTMYHAHSRGGISYARFAHLGKEGVLGRYAIHFHLVGDTMRGSSVVGAAVVDSHNRWITIHGTNYLIVRDCVGYRSVGHGFFFEDGTEVYNVLDRNLGVQAYAGRELPEQVMPFDPNDGAAFWWSNGRNTFVRNTACENDHYGFRYDCQDSRDFDSTRPVRMPDGRERMVDIRTIPFYRFEGNESHTEGLYGMTVAGTDFVGPDTRHPHVIRGLSIWNTHYGFRPQVPKVLAEGLTVHDATYGIYRAEVDHHVYRNVRLSKLKARAIGFAGRADGHGRGGHQTGPFTYDGLTIADVHTRLPLVCMNLTASAPGQAAHFRNVTVQGSDSPRNIVDIQPSEAGLAGTSGLGPVYYFHDQPQPGRVTKVVATKRYPQLAEGEPFADLEGFTGESVQAALVDDVEFPRLLDPVDDLPPTTVITDPAAGATARLVDGVLVIRGTTTDNTRSVRVVVNGVEARDVDFNFHQWEAKLTGLEPGQLTLTATAEDAAGNREQTSHRISVVVQR